MSQDQILIVEDDESLRDLLANLLTESGFGLQTCSSYLKLRTLVMKRALPYGVIILDRLLHGLDSAELIRKMKERHPQIKILVLSAIGSAEEKAAILNRGADDYLAKPFSQSELIARIRSLMRRAERQLKLGNVALDIETRSLRIGRKAVPLPNMEYVLLRKLIGSPGQVFPKNDLYQKIWKMSPDVDSNVLEATITKLRKHLKEGGAEASIRNARNMGYWIES